MDAPESRLPAETKMGRVHLEVADMGRSLEFYRDEIGLHLLEAANDVVRLGAGDEEIVRLTERPGAAPRPPRTIGLYHLAILLPSRRDLGEVFLRLVGAGRPFHGFSDHAVSEAIYLADPDGHGIEIYADRPREAWRWDGDEVYMTTRPLDMERLLQETQVPHGDNGRADHCPDDAPSVPPGTRLGHIHLHVSDLERAKWFYHELLGFDVTTASYPGALFMAAGGYHHHVAVNTWALGRRASLSDVVDLVSFGIVVPRGAARNQLVARVTQAGLIPQVVADGGSAAGSDAAEGGSARPEEADFKVTDPDGNVVVVLSA